VRLERLGFVEIDTWLQEEPLKERLKS